MASSISGWAEGIILAFLAIGILTLVLVSFNGMYGKSYDLGIVSNQTLFVDYNENAQLKIEGGSVELGTDSGITLKDSYGITKDVGMILWSVLSGGFIENVINTFGIGEVGTALAYSIRILYVLSLVFAILFILFKVVI